MFHRSLGLTAAFILLLASPVWALTGRLVDRRTGAPIAGAEITIAGQSGSVRTDADGRFAWKPDPRPPFTFIITLPDGRLARPVPVETLDAAAILTITIDTAVSEEVTVAAGAAPSIDVTPGAAMTMLTGRDVAMRMPGNLVQALEAVPGVNQVSEGQAAVPAVRGLARGRTLLLIDGSRVTSERRVGPSATFLDPATVEAVDVARGAGSVAYGSDAFGGVISVRTRRPAYTGTAFDASITAGAGIPDRRIDVTATRGFGTGGVLVSAHARGVADYDGPDGPVLNSGYRDGGMLVRLERVAGGGLLGASWQSDFGRDIERPRSNSSAVRFYYPYENSHRLNLSWEHPDLAGRGLFRVSGFYGRFSQRTDQDRIPTPARARDIVRADIEASDFQMRSTMEAHIGGTRLEIGADINGRTGLEAHDVLIQYDDGGSIVSEQDFLSVESARRIDTGVFVQSSRQLHRRLLLSGGLRGDYVRSVNRGGFFGNRSIGNGAAAGFLALTAGPFEHLTFTAQVARGFRDPTLSDRFYRGPSGRGFITGNPELEPETSRQFDVGARYATDRVRLAVYGYHYRITDLVERFQADPDFFFFRNRGRAVVRGIEAEAQVLVGQGFAIEASAQRSRGRALDDDAALDDISPDTLFATLRKTFNADLSAWVRVGRYARDDHPGPSEIVAPGHTNLDLGGTWTPQPQIEIRGAIRNLLDERYFASPDPRFVLAPGINGFVTVGVKF